MNLTITSEDFTLTSTASKTQIDHDATLSAGIIESPLDADLAVRFTLTLGNGTTLEFDWSADHTLAFGDMMSSIAHYATGINLKRDMEE